MSILDHYYIDAKYCPNCGGSALFAEGDYGSGLFGQVCLSCGCGFCVEKSIRTLQAEELLNEQTSDLRREQQWDN